jgi:uncharacterized protein YidB (DUF937 family)
MGLLDDVMGMAGIGGAGDPQSPQHAGALAAVLEYINSPQVGGISGLQQMFQQRGLGGVIASWIGTGQNLPISPDQLQNVLHSDALVNIVAKTGLDRTQVASLLSQALPHIVDQLTPNGQVPEPNALSQLSKGLAAQA